MTATKRFLAAGVATAILDGLFAVVLSVCFYGSTFNRLWEGVASVVFGKSATAALGLLMHVVVAFFWSAFFLLAAPLLRGLLHRRGGTWIVAALYGPFVWMAMSLIVIPILAQRAPHLTMRWLVQLVGHAFSVGLPIVWFLAPIARRTTRTGEVVWYATGRFYGSGATAMDAGYFLHLQGIPFEPPVSERTARFTFAAAPFTTIDEPELTLDRRGSFSIYLRDADGASFDDPSSFAAGKRIATFERIAIVPSAKTPPLALNVFSARLVASEPFEFAGRRYRIEDVVGDGITQWGTASLQPLPPPGGYTSAVSFVGSAIRN
ncbi:MAG TPA: hypothetical protein VF824_22415 [Thermoanaerobaculia bacterium]